MERVHNMIRFMLPIAILSLFSGLSYVIVSLQGETQALAVTVAQHIHHSGVTNPITAVLMNFRAYDTFLEMGVLFVALLGAYAQSTGTIVNISLLQSSVLERLVGILVPLLLLLSLYLLWVGAHAPGGAFQAGSTVSAAWILLYLSGRKYNISLSYLYVRLSAGISLLAFIVVSALTLLLTHTLLGFSPVFAFAYILLLEATATLSIGITLLHLFLRIFLYTKERS